MGASFWTSSSGAADDSELLSEKSAMVAARGWLRSWKSRSCGTEVDGFQAERDVN